MRILTIWGGSEPIVGGHALCSATGVSYYEPRTPQGTKANTGKGGGAQNNTITYGISCRCQDGIDDLRDTWRCNNCERYDGHALWALLQSRRGPITKLLATSAFASTSMTVSLMSYPALRQAGWYLIDAPGAVPFCNTTTVTKWNLKSTAMSTSGWRLKLCPPLQRQQLVNQLNGKTALLGLLGMNPQ